MTENIESLPTDRRQALLEFLGKRPEDVEAEKSQGQDVNFSLGEYRWERGQASALEELAGIRQGILALLSDPEVKAAGFDLRPLATTLPLQHIDSPDRVEVSYSELGPYLVIEGIMLDADRQPLRYKGEVVRERPWYLDSHLAEGTPE